MSRGLKINLLRLGIPLRLIGAAAAVIALGLNAVPFQLAEALRTARAAANSGNYTSAALAYHQAYDYAPWSTKYLVSALEIEMQYQQYADAALDLDRLAALRPLTVREQVWLGEIYAARGEPDRAAEIWEQARLQGSLDAETLSTLAAFYVEHGRWDQAVAVLEALIAQTPNDASLYYRLGVIQSLNAPDQAAVTLAQAVGLDASYAGPLAYMRAMLDSWDSRALDQSYANIGTGLLTLNEFPLAEEAFSRAVVHNNVYADALAYLAYARARQDKPALSIAQQAAALAPDSPRVHYLVGLTWKQYHRPIEARQAFERAYDLDPRNPALCVEIASTHRAEGSREWAEHWMVESVRLVPDDPRFRLLLVQFYVDEEYKVAEEGLPLAQQLVSDYPDSAEAHDALAWAYFLIGEIGRAQAELDIAMTLDPDLGRAYVHMGQIMEMQGRLSEALWYYQRAAELEPEGPIGAMARRAIERLGGG